MNNDGSFPRASNPLQEATSANHFHLIVAEGEEGILMLSKSGIILYANAAAEFLLGLERESLVGEMFGELLTSEASGTEINTISTDGKVRFVEVQIEPLQTPEGETTIVRLRDVTDYHVDLQDAKEQVKRRDEFLAMLSHEIRNPLAAIKSASFLLTREEPNQHQRKQASEVLDRQFTHLGRILDDLLDITRISRGKMELLKERIDLRPILQDTLDTVRSAMQKKDHDFQVDLPDKAITVWGDGTRLEQIFVNLLNNACKFTRKYSVNRLQHWTDSCKTTVFPLSVRLICEFVTG